MRYARKSPEALRELRGSLPERLVSERPEIAEAARWIREAIGLNQEDFAKLVGLSKPLVAKLERGEANPTLDTLKAIGKPFGLRIAFVPQTMPTAGEPAPAGEARRDTAATSDYTAAAPAPKPRRKLPPLSFEKTKLK